MLLNNYIDQIAKGKRKPIKSVKQSEESFPLIMIDKSMNRYVRLFDNPHELGEELA